MTELTDEQVDALKARAGEVFYCDGLETPQDVRDVIEWYDRSLRLMLAAQLAQEAEVQSIEIWHGNRKVTIYPGENVMCMDERVARGEFVSDVPYTGRAAQEALDWLYEPVPAPVQAGEPDAFVSDLFPSLRRLFNDAGFPDETRLISAHSSPPIGTQESGKQDRHGVWIPVSERLPEKFVEVLIAFAGNTLPATGQYTGNLRDSDDGWSYPSENGTEGDGIDWMVTHWMPLPDHPDSAMRSAHMAGEATAKGGE